jgi:glycerol-3-phosphate dehydrogenase
MEENKITKILMEDAYNSIKQSDKEIIIHIPPQYIRRILNLLNKKYSWYKYIIKTKKGRKKIRNLVNTIITYWK